MTDWLIPLSAPSYGHEEDDAVRRVLTSGWLSMGPEVQAFEEEFARFQSSRHAVAVANGTAGLHLALLALGIGPGDEVIQPAMNFVAAANMTAATGATPIFADILGLDEPTIDPACVEGLVTRRTKAVIVMHYGGHLCRTGELLEICRRHRVHLIEDACHAIGASLADGTRAGSGGDIGVFSFFSNKNLATGEGGMVVTACDELGARVRLLRSHGMNSLTWDRHKGHAATYDVLANGYNYRLDEIHGALGRAQLSKLAAGNQKRGSLTRRYWRLLSDLPDWRLPFARLGGDSAFHLLAVVAPDATLRTRAAEFLRGERIQSSFHYPCVPDFSAFARHRSTAVALSQEFAQRVLTLPLYSSMTEGAVDQVVSALRCAATSGKP